MEENPNTDLDIIENDEESAGSETYNAASEASGSPAQSPEDIYVYDAEDDEPVDDRDYYRDYTGAGHRTVSGKAPEKPASTDHATPRPSKERAVSSYMPETYRSENSPEPDDREVSGLYGGTESNRHGKSAIKIDKIYTLNTIISMITLCVVAAGIFTGYAYVKKLEYELGINKGRITKLEDYHNEENKETDDEEEKYVDAVSLVDEEKKESVIPEGEYEVDIERGKLLLYDSYVGYSWVPIISGVKPHTYNKENFHVDDDLRMTYVVNGDVSSYFGIDVSSYQGDIDWDAVRSDGVEFAILRIGVRGYAPEGNIKLDDKFIQNYENAHKAGIDLGVYFYSQAISVEEAVEEANFVLKQLDGRKLEYPVVFDWEPVDATEDDIPPRTEDVMPGTLTLSALAFCETIRDAGYEAMIYTNKKMAYIKYDMRKFTDYPVWLALYNTDLTYYYDFDMWQYGFGKVNGIEGDVDLDIAMIR